MKKNKALIILLIIFMTFFCYSEKIMAKKEKANLKSTGKCSDYYTIRDSSVYGEGSSGLVCSRQAYVKGELRPYKYVDETPECDNKILDKSDMVTTAWYYQPEKKADISKDASLTIDVYNKDGQKICSDIITGFNTDEKTVKIALKHDKIIQSVKLKGTFKNGDSKSYGEIDLEIVESTTTTELNTERGTQVGIKKSDKMKTNTNGDVIIETQNSCTDVSNIIHEYWSYVMVIVPVLLIIVMSIDFFKAMASNDADAIKKAGTNTFKRVLAAVILLALPVLLNTIFKWFGLKLCI